MPRSLILPIALLLLALVVPPAIQAASVTEVSILACHNDGGQIAVPRRSDLWLEMYWGSVTAKQSSQFINRVKTVAKIDGAPVSHARTYFLEPYENGFGDWIASWSYPAGQLRRDESLTVTLQWKLLRGVSDGYSWYRPGPIFDPKLKCTITAQ